MNATITSIRPGREALPFAVPADYTGPLTLPGSGRAVWWTGRVAIGLRHEAPARVMTGASERWVQSLLLAA